MALESLALRLQEVGYEVEYAPFGSVCQKLLIATPNKVRYQVYRVYGSYCIAKSHLDTAVEFATFTDMDAAFLFLDTIKKRKSW